MGGTVCVVDFLTLNPSANPVGSMHSFAVSGSNFTASAAPSISEGKLAHQHFPNTATYSLSGLYSQ